MRHRLARALSSEKAKALSIILFAACLAMSGWAIWHFNATQNAETRAIATQALKVARLNHRLLQLENPTDAQLRARVDAAIARLNRLERERLLRLLLSAVPPATLQELIAQGDLAPAVRLPPSRTAAQQHVPPLMPLCCFAHRHPTEPTPPRPPGTSTPAPPPARPAPGPRPSPPPPRPTPPPRPLLPPLPLPVPVPSLPPVTLPTPRL